jgi:rhomboid protease GluP
LETAPIDDPFGRLLAALATPRVGHAEASLVAYQPPVAVLELLGEGGIVVLDVAGATPAEVEQRAGRITSTYQGGHLFLVITGGGPEHRPAVEAVDRKALDARRLSVFHLDRTGALHRVAGARSKVIEAAARALPSTPPLPADAVPALIARGQREREETVNFAAQLRGRRPWVTIALVAACVLVHLLDQSWGSGARWGANFGPAVREGQVWRLLSSAFLHGNTVHLMMNMLGLWSFGGFLEPVLGWRRYLVVYGLSALVGSLASAFLGTRASVGASGALWGLMLAGFALLRRQGIFPARTARLLRQRLVGIVGINVGISFLIPNIDKFAHFGGGIAGFLLVASGLLAPRTVGAVGDEAGWIRVAAPLTAVLLVLSVLVALWVGRPWATEATALLLHLGGVAVGQVTAG